MFWGARKLNPAHDRELGHRIAQFCRMCCYRIMRLKRVGILHNLKDFGIRNRIKKKPFVDVPK